MNAREFLDEFGTKEAEKVATRAGTNLAYFAQLACGARRPSFDMAERLVAASEGKLDVLALMRAKAERDEAKQAAESNPPGRAA